MLFPQPAGEAGRGGQAHDAPAYPARAGQASARSARLDLPHQGPLLRGDHRGTVAHRRGWSPRAAGARQDLHALMPHRLALDQGTTSSRAIVFTEDGAVAGMAQRELTQFYPSPGLVEHDPDEIWSTQLDTARQAMREAGIGAADIAAVGLTNQRETVVMWERRSGRPIHRAIVWQDRRTA